MDPKSLSSIFDFYKTKTPEERYNNAVTLLEQWNSEYAKKHIKNPPPHHLPILATKLQVDAEKQKEC